MTNYMNKVFSLEEKALAQVAINLCQLDSFKEVALNLEKPTYGSFTYDVPFPEPTFFVSDPATLATWAKVKGDKRLRKAFQESRHFVEGEHLARWHAAVDEQCLKLTEGMPLPNPLKQRIRPWIKRIALEYLTYCRRQEVLFDVSRYFLMNVLTTGDWKLDGRVDEEKVARRLLEDERLTVLQKYLIACVYCLEVHIEQLWNRLTQKAKRFFVRGRGQKHIGDSHSSVHVWSRFMNGDIEEQELWSEAVYEAIRCGNRSALMASWRKLSEPVQQKIVIDSALGSLEQWEKMESYGRVEEELVSPLVPGGLRFVEDCTLSSYYSGLTVFLLLQMDQEQIVALFKRAFEWHSKAEIIKFLLDWPYQDYFLPTLNRLWGMLSKDDYKQCLMALAKKYGRSAGKANCDYDYGSLLGTLWEETPEEYKKYVFHRKSEHLLRIGETGTVLSVLLSRSPFQEKDQMLFKQIFRDQPQEKRREMMLTDNEEGEFMCSRLIQEEKWTFLNWLLTECLSQEEIVSFKKRVIPSFFGFRLCMDLFEKNREKLVEDLFDWCVESDAQKAKCKRKFISGRDCLYACETLLREGKFAEVERVVNFCSSVEEKEQFKVRFALKACGTLLGNYTNDSWLEDDVWEQMDTVIAWSVDAEEKMKQFKKDLISHAGVETHYTLVFDIRIREKTERFYQWFDLTSEEIKQLKWDTLFTSTALNAIEDELRSNKGSLSTPLRWCLTDDEMMINFKKEVKRYYGFLWKAEHLDELLSQLLEGIKKVQVVTNEGDVSVKDKEGKRSVAVEDKSNSPKKRPK